MCEATCSFTPNLCDDCQKFVVNAIQKSEKDGRFFHLINYQNICEYFYNDKFYHNIIMQHSISIAYINKHKDCILSVLDYAIDLKIFSWASIKIISTYSNTLTIMLHSDYFDSDLFETFMLTYVDSHIAEILIHDIIKNHRMLLGMFEFANDESILCFAKFLNMLSFRFDAVSNLKNKIIITKP